jgi:hypothetical protein
MAESEKSGEFYRVQPDAKEPHEATEKLRIPGEPLEDPAYLGTDPSDRIIARWGYLSFTLGVVDTVLSVIRLCLVCTKPDWSVLFLIFPLLFCCVQPLLPLGGLIYGIRSLSGTGRTRALAVWGITLAVANAIGYVAMWPFTG